jgi:hypothetical protein
MVTTTCPAETDCDRWRREYADALAALHSLNIGGTVASISSGDGKNVSYHKAQRGELAAYVTQLKAKVDRCNGIGNCYGNPRSIQMIPNF